MQNYNVPALTQGKKGSELYLIAKRGGEGGEGEGAGGGGGREGGGREGCGVVVWKGRWETGFVVGGERYGMGEVD